MANDTPLNAEDDTSLGKQVDLTIEQGYGKLKFPAALEAAYIDSHQVKIRQNLQEHAWSYLGIYLFFTAFLYSLVPYQDTGWYVYIIPFLFVGLVIAIILTRVGSLDPHTEMLGGMSSFIAITLVMIGKTTVATAQMQDISMVGIILLILTMYTFLDIRFRVATAWGLATGPAFLLFCFATGNSVDMVMFLSYYLAPNIMGAAIGYAHEFKDRTVFLQEIALKNEKARLEQAYEEMERLSRQDGLTGLFNRRHFNEMLPVEWSRAARSGQPVTLIITDIDFFKQYNDHYGHQGGDEALKKVGEVFRASAARRTDLACRYGGEEFVLLLPDTSREQALIVLQRMDEALKSAAIPHEKSTVSKHVTISQGVYTSVPEDAAGYEHALKLADDALYEAKRQGRNRWVFAE